MAAAEARQSQLPPNLKHTLDMPEATRTVPVFTEAVKLTDKESSAFWARVVKTDTCWLWQPPLSMYGYGYFYLKGKQIRAHRLSWLACKGSIPEAIFVCHKCDVRNCVNPDHLFLGSAADNVQDMVSKGRAPTGSKSGAHKHPEKVPRGDSHCWRLKPHLIPRGEDGSAAKLTNENVLDIRSLHASGMSTRKLAAQFGCTPKNIRLIVSRKTWIHI